MRLEVARTTVRRRPAGPLVYLTAHMIAERYCVSIRTVWRWRSDPNIWLPKPAIYISGKPRWLLSELIAAEAKLRR